MDVESTKPVHTLELAEAVERYFAGSGNELKKLGSLFLVERAHGAPEPLDLCGRGGVVMILGIVLPIVHVDIREAGDEKLELLFVEDRYQFGGNNVMEA